MPHDLHAANSLREGITDQIPRMATRGWAERHQKSLTLIKPTFTDVERQAECLLSYRAVVVACPVSSLPGRLQMPSVVGLLERVVAKPTEIQETLLPQFGPRRGTDGWCDRIAVGQGGTASTDTIRYGTAEATVRTRSSSSPVRCCARTGRRRPWSSSPGGRAPWTSRQPDCHGSADPDARQRTTGSQHPT